MKGLILKDLYNLKKYGKTVFMISAFYVMLMLIMGNEGMFAGMIVLLFAVTSITSFSYDSQSGWDVFVHTLPVARKDVVMSKYLLSYLLALAGGLLVLFVGWAGGLIKNINNFSDTLIASYALLAVGVIFINILLPLVYKFGVERSRIMVLAVIGIPVAAFIVLVQTGTFVVPDEQTIRRVLIWSPLVLVMCSLLSFAVSNAVYRNKEV